VASRHRGRQMRQRPRNTYYLALMKTRKPNEAVGRGPPRWSCRPSGGVTHVTFRQGARQHAPNKDKRHQADRVAYGLEQRSISTPT